MSVDGANRALDTPGARYGERMRRNMSAEALQESVIAAERASLEHTFAQLSSSGVVPRAAAVILRARRRYIAGAGKSAAYASLLGADLAATLANVFVIDGKALSELDVLSDVRASDVLVLFSLRRYRRDTVVLGRRFRRAGGELIVVTDDARAPLARSATVLVLVDTSSASYADSPTSVAAVCLLMSTLSAASSKGAARRLRARDAIVEEMGLYDDDEAKEATR